MKVLQVFRAPVGGLFRHVRDLARGLNEQGLEVGVVCDSTAGDELAEQRLQELETHCRLGVTRVAMSRLPGPGDLSTAGKVVAAARALQPDIVHGHGAKGGAYARLAAARLGAKSVYTPHGGVLHYKWSSRKGLPSCLPSGFCCAKPAAWFLFVITNAQAFSAKIGLGSTANTVVHNGLWGEEFKPVALNRTQRTFSSWASCGP
jgi:glycosyltransferase involved in cell wall biosynthesis